MNLDPCEFTSYGGLRIKQEAIIFKEDPILTNFDYMSSSIEIGGEHQAIAIKIEEGMIRHDKFCWRCCGEDTTLKCSNCVRSFHTNCVSKDETDRGGSDSWLCSVCVSLKKAENVDKKSNLEMLPILMGKVMKDKYYNTLQHPLKGTTDETIVNPIDLTKIKEIIGTYTSFEHFLADIQWIVHNSFILIAVNHTTLEVAKSLVDYLEEEIEMIKKCAECYLNADKHPNTWFTMTCNEPHLIVWAKKMGFTYWPAKMISIDGQLINVRFFGDHKYADVPTTNCFLYSDTNPNKSRNTTVSYKSALKEAETYIKNARQKFGSYNLVETKTAFNPSLLSKFIVQVIPELAESNMIKSLENKTKVPEQSCQKQNPKPTPRTEETESTTRKVMAPIIDKNIVIPLARIDQNDDEKSSNAKRTSSASSDKDQPREKKAKLSNQNVNDSTPRSEKKHGVSANVTTDKSVKNVVLIEGSTDSFNRPETKHNGTTNGSADKSLKNDAPSKESSENITSKNNTKIVNESISVNDVNVAVSSAQAKDTDGQEEPAKNMLNSTEVESAPSDLKFLSQSTISDLSFINGHSIEESSSTANFDDLDWEQSFNKDINETVRAASATMCSVVENKLKSKFEVLKNRLQSVTLERDQVTLGAERSKLKAKEDHAKEIAELSEKYAQVIAKTKKDADTFWTTKLEEEKTKSEKQLKEAEKKMIEKVADVEINLANAKIVYEEEKKVHNQEMTKLQEQHKMEIESEKERTTTEIERTKKEHDKVIELEKKLQDAIEAKASMETQLEAKYRDIVAGIRQKAEIERKERMSCACCGKPLETKRTCSSECEQMWGVWKSPDVSQKME